MLDVQSSIRIDIHHVVRKYFYSLLLMLMYLCTYIARPPSLARRRSPAAGLVRCAQQYQQVVRTAVTYQVGNAVTYVVLCAVCVRSTFCAPLKRYDT